MAAEPKVLCCPSCHDDQVGEADMIPGTAQGEWVENADGTREFNPGGYTDVHWDGQHIADKDAPCYCRACYWSGKPEELVLP